MKTKRITKFEMFWDYQRKSALPFDEIRIFGLYPIRTWDSQDIFKRLIELGVAEVTSRCVKTGTILEIEIDRNFSIKDLELYCIGLVRLEKAQALKREKEIADQAAEIIKSGRVKEYFKRP